jgi:hypothetical protein
VRPGLVVSEYDVTSFEVTRFEYEPRFPFDGEYRIWRS